jgi:hypothetical protein
MNLFGSAVIGKRNIVFGIVQFVVLGVIVGVPLTIDLFGGSLLTGDQYQSWKVVHGYSVFLALINYFVGVTVDRLNLTRRAMELCSWSFLGAGAVGGLGRMALLLTGVSRALWLGVSLVETVLVVAGVLAFVKGQLRKNTLAAQPSVR